MKIVVFWDVKPSFLCSENVGSTFLRKFSYLPIKIHDSNFNPDIADKSPVDDISYPAPKKIRLR
jgi:hypothetical protein